MQQGEYMASINSKYRLFPALLIIWIYFSIYFTGVEKSFKPQTIYDLPMYL